MAGCSAGAVHWRFFMEDQPVRFQTLAQLLKPHKKLGLNTWTPTSGFLIGRLGEWWAISEPSSAGRSTSTVCWRAVAWMRTEPEAEALARHLTEESNGEESQRRNGKCAE